MDFTDMDKALKSIWQSVSQNMHVVQIMLLTHEASEDTRVLLSRSETIIKDIFHIKGLTTDTYTVGYLRPGNDMTVCRVEVKPEAMPEVLLRLTALNGVLLSIIVRLLTANGK